jgi:hypothetical protein
MCLVLEGLSVLRKPPFETSASAASVKFAELCQECGFHFAKGVFQRVIQR